jgi:protoporphyrinogen IX oxidase
MIVALKLLHIAALSIWCAGLVALPLLLAKHDQRDQQQTFTRLRLLTHPAYIGLVTPAAIIAIATGTALIFMRGVFVPWLFFKLVFVGSLVLIHAWIGHIAVSAGERQGSYEPPRARWLLTLSLAAMCAILILVLGKPLLGDRLAPAWLNQPMDQPLPVDEVPM